MSRSTGNFGQAICIFPWRIISEEGRKGMANWFRVQFKEEFDHAQIFINYLNARGGKVVLSPINAVPQGWESPLAAFAATLAHEQEVTRRIHDLYALAEEERFRYSSETELVCG